MTSATRSLRILLRFDWPSGLTERLWDGSGPLTDNEQQIWKGVTISEGLDTLEQAFNGDAVTLNLGLTGVSRSIADLHWLSHEAGSIVGGLVKIYTQACDSLDRLQGSPRVRFAATVDNVIFDDYVEGETAMSNVMTECTNRFTLRRVRHGSVLSDPDQRARAAVLNPSGNPDRFCERVPMMNDKTIVWPRWN